MAVYTQLTKQQINTLLAPLELGQVIKVNGIEDGIENSTYFVDLISDHQQTAAVLTVFEYMKAEELPFFIELTTTLNKEGLAVPSPFHSPAGQAILTAAGKPALLFPRAPGGHITQLQPEQCFEIGQFLAQMHYTTSRSGALQRESTRGADWITATATRLQPKLPLEEAALVDDYLSLMAENESELNALPSAIIHADLFHDNALFNDGHLSAVIDFYFSANGLCLYDLAIIANDWCWSSDSMGYDHNKFSALFEGYQSIRQLTDAERHFWPLISQLAIFRFWLSRREDELFCSDRRLKSAYQLRSRLEWLQNNVDKFSNIE